MNKILEIIGASFTVLVGYIFLTFFLVAFPAHASYHFSDFQGRSPIHIYASDTKSP